MAIAFDASSTGANVGVGVLTLTWSHTCTGTDRILFIGLEEFDNTITSVKYNGVSATEVQSQVVIANGMHLFVLVNPATGANNIVVTVTSNTFGTLGGGAVSYTGAKQTSQPDASAKSNTGAGQTTITGTVTTVADNCWKVCVAVTSSGAATISAGTGTTQRVNVGYFGGTNQMALMDSNGVVTPPGSSSLVANSSLAATLGIIIASFAPVAAGPANIKTVNGLAKASVKTVNGLAIASVKSINGLT